MKIQPVISLDEIKDLKKRVLKGILENNPSHVKKICYTVGRLFSKTNDLGKTYIDNLFVLPVTLMIEADYGNRKKFLDLFPINLKAEYVKKLYHSAL